MFVPSSLTPGPEPLLWPWDELFALLNQMFNGIQTLLTISDTIRELVQSVKNQITTLTTWVKTAFTALTDAMKTSFDKLTSGITASFSAVTGWLKSRLLLRWF
jgi:hypothetical protein